MKNVRESKYELLRIISMIMIISNHFVRHGIIYATTNVEYKAWNQGPEFNRVFSSLFLPGGRVGVAIFFLITGYFGYSINKNISLCKVIEISIFYSLFLTLGSVICSFAGIGEFGISYYIRLLCLPLSAGLGWFVTSYIFVCLLQTKLNSVLDVLNTRGMFIWFMWLWVIEYTLHNYFDTNIYMLIRGILFYQLGAVLYIEKDCILKHKGFFVNVSFFVIFWLLGVFCEYKSGINHIRNIYSIDKMNQVYEIIISSFTVPICAVQLFSIFMKFPLKHNPLINKLASTTFGVYLLHDSSLGHTVFWEHMFKCEEQFQNNLFPLTMIFSVFAVFAICAMIDIFRSIYFNKWINPLKGSISNIIKRNFIS